MVLNTCQERIPAKAWVRWGNWLRFCVFVFTVGYVLYKSICHGIVTTPIGVYTMAFVVALAARHLGSQVIPVNPDANWVARVWFEVMELSVFLSCVVPLLWCILKNPDLFAEEIGPDGRAFYICQRNLAVFFCRFGILAFYPWLRERPLTECLLLSLWIMMFIH